MRATADFVTPDANMALIFNISSFTLTTFPVCPGGLPNCMPAFFLAASASFVLCEIRFLSISAASANANAIIFELMLSVRLKLSLMVRMNTPFWEHAFSIDIIMSMLRPRREISVHTSMSASEIAAARETQIGTALKAAVDYFIDYAGCDNAGNQLPDSPMKGGIVIFAAGNDASQYGPPANYERILAVGSIDRNGSRSSFSNYGDWVDICAPGGDIYSTLPNNRYGSMSGTSMACPHVSGVAALLVSELGGPGFTNEMLWDRLVGGANSDAAPSVAGRNIGPLLDAYGAFTYGGTTPPERVEDYTAEGFGGLIDFSWTVTADEDNGKAYGYFLLVSENRSLLENIDPSDIPSGVHYVTVPVGDREAGDGMTGAVSGLEFATQYYVAIVGYDYQRNYSELSEIKEVATTQNNAPVISTAETGAIELKSHETFTRSYIVKDPAAGDSPLRNTMTFGLGYSF